MKRCHFIFLFIKKKEREEEANNTEWERGRNWQRRGWGKKTRRRRRRVETIRREGREEGNKTSTDWDGASHTMGRKWRVTEDDGVRCF